MFTPLFIIIEHSADPNPHFDYRIMNKSHQTRFERLLREERQSLWSQRDAWFDGKPLEGADPSTEHSEDDIFDRLQSIQFALGRIAAGTYGTCAKCGREISLERLKVQPAACLCLDCQIAKEAIEQGNLRSPPPSDRTPVLRKVSAPRPCLLGGFSPPARLSFGQHSQTKREAMLFSVGRWEAGDSSPLPP